MGLYIIAFGIILAGALVPRLRRSSHPGAKFLTQSFGVKPSGPNGAWTRHDHWRSARGYAMATVASIVLALTVMGFADRWPNGSTPNLALSLPGMVLFMLGLVAGWLAARSCLRAMFRRAAV